MQPPAHAGLQASLLERLTNPASGGTAARPGLSVAEYAEGVRRDLEALLNTRATPAAAFDGYPEVHASVAGYGVPDLVTFESLSVQKCAALARVVERSIARFEPRLKTVRATVVETPTGEHRVLRVRVSARLALDPAPSVAFDTILELTDGAHQVRRPG